MDSDNEPFLYTGQSRKDIPRNVNHVKVDPSVKGIGWKAFQDCNQLRSVELCEGLEDINTGAFDCCTSLGSIRIPSTVKEIGWCAFEDCNQLINVELCEGLERIKERAFHRCTSLQRVNIPSTVKWIGKKAFANCSALEAIEFCDEIEQFVDEVPLTWWNNGVLEASLRTYSFLVEGNIPARVGTIKVQEWKKNIHDMLRHIPEMLKEDDNEEDSDDSSYNSDYDMEEGGVYFESIHYRLFNYEKVQDALTVLELACWKAKMTENLNGNVIINHDMKVSSCHKDDALSMSGIIIPNVLPFLLDD